MIPKIKKYIVKNKKMVTRILIFVIILIILLMLYKMIFYSSSEKANYGVRIKDIKDYPFDNKKMSELEEKTKAIEGFDNVKITLKGRLIKYFITSADGVSKEDIKNKVNESLGFIDDKTKGYYDITVYVSQTIDGEKKYPIIGYKHKSKDVMTFDEL